MLLSRRRVAARDGRAGRPTRPQRRRYLLALLAAALLIGCGVAQAGGTKYAKYAATAPDVVKLQLNPAAFAPEAIHVTIYLPPGYARNDARGTRYPVLYANDGQDMAAVGLQPTLARLQRAHAMRPIIVVAVGMLTDRASAYGLSDRQTARSIVGGSRIGLIGTRAQDYSAWLATELVPYIDAHYRTLPDARSRAVLGWSLGALNAFNLGWQYPDVFGTVGAFSPSFWLAADRSSSDAIQRTRLAQRMIGTSRKRAHLRLWFAVGSAEETADRDADGINDTVDDVHDLVFGCRTAAGLQAPGLKQLGYPIDADPRATPHAAVVLTVLHGGQHNQASWKRMLPGFLRWAFGRAAR